MKRQGLKWMLALLAAGAILFFSRDMIREGEVPETTPHGTGADAVAVELAPVRIGPMRLLRTFSGTLAARSECLVAPKVSGRVEYLAADLGDEVTRGQVVAKLDNGEFVQAVAQAEADLAVAVAGRTEAKSSLEIAGRELKRMQTLKTKGVSSPAQVDAARAKHLAAEAKLEIAKARVLRARAVLESARIRLGYTTVAAEWQGGDTVRFVAEKRMSHAEMVPANTPLLRLVELSPLTGILFVTEKDFARLVPGQKASISTDTYPGEVFSGHISRIAPVFDEATRQARVELEVENPGYRLKPGMFARISVVLDRVADAVMVPEAALAKRNGRQGIFLVRLSGDTVSWQPVETGIRQGNFIQIKNTDISGQVVTLGHQMLKHGSRIRLTGQSAESRTN
ncbi:MAG TPA: efflux RND transporter periplasmic adaptor subunit [Desulfobacteraceae bacterium]|nr:efflux RND transporter periplasmic adaptor subunit [Desulfobacteraceae bacterium]